MVRGARFLSTVEIYISKPKPRERTETGFVVKKCKQENQKRNGKKSDVLVILLCIVSCVLLCFSQGEDLR